MSCTMLSLLVERSYPVPRRFRTLFWDFYCLYDLWWTYGSGREGTSLPPEIRAGGLNRRVDHDFTEVATVLARTMVTLMCYNVSDEALNGEDQLYADQRSIAAWCESNGLSSLVHGGQFKAPTPEDLRRGNPDMLRMGSLFLAPFWGDEKSGWGQEYGPRGKAVGATGHVQVFDVADQNWAHLCSLTAKLWAALKAGNLRQMVMGIDRLMHAEHNNGSIFNRPPMRKLGIRLTKQDLDLRAAARGPEDFLPHVSDYVKRLASALTQKLVEGLLEAEASGPSDTVAETGSPLS